MMHAFLLANTTTLKFACSFTSTKRKWIVSAFSFVTLSLDSTKSQSVAESWLAAFCEILRRDVSIRRFVLQNFGAIWLNDNIITC